VPEWLAIENGPCLNVDDELNVYMVVTARLIGNLHNPNFRDILKNELKELLTKAWML
jgi:hypothetical protein